MTSSIDQIVVVDTETTGFDPNESAQLLEVAWVSLRRTESGWEYGADGTYGSSMVEYTGKIPAEARAVHHISPEMVSPGATNCLPRSSVIHSLVAAEEPGTMLYAAHNAAFDAAFLPELGRATEEGESCQFICTWRCALHLFPDTPKHSNQVIRYHEGIEPPAHMLTDPETGVALGAHRALYDTACTAAILARMLETHTPEELLVLARTPVLLKTVRFGKHKNQDWDTVPIDYLRWMLRSSDMLAGDMDLRYTVRHHMNLPQDVVL